jgi:hypothetical protein
MPAKKTQDGGRERDECGINPVNIMNNRTHDEDEQSDPYVPVSIQFC